MKALSLVCLLLALTQVTLAARIRADEASESGAPQGEDTGQNAPPQGEDSGQGLPQGASQENDSAQGDSHPAPVAPDPAFLNLQAYDVEALAADAARVGDRLQLKIAGAGALPSSGGFQLALPKGIEPGTVLDQGLDIPALAGTDADADEKASAPPQQPGAVPSPAPVLAVAGSDLNFAVVAAKPGRLAIPSLEIRDGSGKAIARTNPFTLSVESAITPEDKKPKDPVPPRPPVMLSFPWIVIAALALLALLVIGGIIYAIVRWSRRARPVPVVPAAPAKSEDEVALAAFSELEKQRLLDKGQFKKHYFQVSEVLKAYLGARYGVDAVESTTREMLAMLEHSTLPPESQRELAALFTKLDFVKFTDHVPDQGEGEELLVRARALVLKTRKPPQLQTPILQASTPVKATAEAPRAI